MRPRARLVVFAIGALGVAALLVWGLGGVPDLGHYRGPYGDILNRQAVHERHATNVVNSVTFDYRGIDTVGEEFILFAAVMGVTLLLRRQREEEEGPGPAGGSPFGRTTDALRIGALALAGPAIVLAIYVVTHGHLTPGGGFQGGLMLGAGPLVAYLAGRHLTRRSTEPTGPLELGEATGAGGFVVVGLTGLVATGAFLENVWPLGQVGSVFSGGMLPVINLCVGLEVGVDYLAVHAAGRLFLGAHLLAFEVTSIVLLIAAIGGVILGTAVPRESKS